MFKIVEKSSRNILIRRDTDLRAFPIKCFKRAEGRKNRNAKIRKPIEILIDGVPYIFTQREWEAAGPGPWKTSLRDLRHMLKAEIREKADNSKKLSKMRDARLKREADAFYYRKHNS